MSTIENKKERTIFSETLYLSTNIDIDDDGEWYETIEGYKFVESPFYCPEDVIYGEDIGKNSIYNILDRNDVYNIDHNNYVDFHGLNFNYEHDYRI